jgi:hypothetical protein
MVFLVTPGCKTETRHERYSYINPDIIEVFVDRAGEFLVIAERYADNDLIWLPKKSCLNCCGARNRPALTLQ